MFGFKKKSVRPNPLWDNIHEKMRYELHHNNDEERQSYDDRYDDVPLLPKGMRNNSIAQSLYFQIEPQHRMIWYKIDLEEYFAEDVPMLSSRELDLTGSD